MCVRERDQDVWSADQMSLLNESLVIFWSRCAGSTRLGAVWRHSATFPMTVASEKPSRLLLIAFPPPRLYFSFPFLFLSHPTPCVSFHKRISTLPDNLIFTVWDTGRFRLFRAASDIFRLKTSSRRVSADRDRNMFTVAAVCSFFTVHQNVNSLSIRLIQLTIMTQSLLSLVLMIYWSSNVTRNSWNKGSMLSQAISEHFNHCFSSLSSFSIPSSSPYSISIYPFVSLIPSSETEIALCVAADNWNRSIPGLHCMCVREGAIVTCTHTHTVLNVIPRHSLLALSEKDAPSCTSKPSETLSLSCSQSTISVNFNTRLLLFREAFFFLKKRLFLY